MSPSSVDEIGLLLLTDNSRESYCAMYQSGVTFVHLLSLIYAHRWMIHLQLNGNDQIRISSNNSVFFFRD